MPGTSASPVDCFVGGAAKKHIGNGTKPFAAKRESIPKPGMVIKALTNNGPKTALTGDRHDQSAFCHLRGWLCGCRLHRPARLCPPGRSQRAPPAGQGGP